MAHAWSCTLLSLPSFSQKYRLFTNKSMPNAPFHVSGYTEENADIYRSSIAALGLHRRYVRAEVGFEPETLQLRISDNLTAVLGSAPEVERRLIPPHIVPGLLSRPPPCLSSLIGSIPHEWQRSSTAVQLGASSQLLPLLMD